MIKVGHLVPCIVIKALPHYSSYLCLIEGSELMGLLPRDYAGKVFKTGDTLVASVFSIDGTRIVLSQKSSQFFRKLTEFLIAPLLQEQKAKVVRAACIKNAGFAKVAVKSLNGEDPVRMCLPFMKSASLYTDDTITIVPFSDDPRQFIVNALLPAPPDGVKKVLHLQMLREAVVYVEPSLLGIFLGRGGLNAATASKLTGVAIKIKT